MTGGLGLKAWSTHVVGAEGTGNRVEAAMEFSPQERDWVSSMHIFHIS